MARAHQVGETDKKEQKTLQDLSLKVVLYSQKNWVEAV
jgi:hypothetical protein